MSVEDIFVSTFIIPERQSRYIELLSSSEKRRKILDRLNHSFDIVESLSTEVPRDVCSLALLQSRGAPSLCHVIADSHPLDGCENTLSEAVEELEGHMFGYVIICVPDRLALYQPECPSNALLLERSWD